HLVDGRSAAAVFPTGGGKSLCYQLPALRFPGLTLVVSPLIALMKDQIDQLRRRGIAAARLDSTLTLDEYREVMGAVRSGTLKLLYVAPERFNNERFREAIQRIAVSLFAVDEAHCISEWGHNFRPDYLKLVELAKLCGAERILALTATATPQVLDDICRSFSIASECAVRTGFYRPNLTLLTTPVSRGERDTALLGQIEERERGPTIVYVTQQKTSEQVAARLSAAGFAAEAYHAGMQKEDRARVQDAFLASDHAIVVATIAFGMGIDKADIRYVYHYNLPKSLENLSQEIGRAGRDGKPSICEIFVWPDDLNVLRNFAYGDTPSPPAVAGLVEEVFAAGDEASWSLYDLAGRHDIRQLVVRTLLTYLELDGYLQAGTPTYSSYRFRPLMSSEEILARFEGERRQFLGRLFRHARKAKIWFDIDLERAARSLGTPRDRLVRAFDYLAEQKMLELQSTGVLHPYRRLRRPDDVGALAAELHRRTLERERREIARLDQVLELMALDDCQTSRLSTHFGEPLDQPCGHCSWCRNGGQPLELPSPSPPAIDEEVWRKLTALRREHGDALSDPRSLVRFLTGLSSPRLTRLRLSSHELFGCFADVPFGEVLRRVEAEPLDD
ncbi:MAG: RecQ family ATP-dependent DNA helicase, partial [bacterium]|nr:RecQ family ATP-dependent DNA helicase [bacterium]